jgi:hypothetical protein
MCVCVSCPSNLCVKPLSLSSVYEDLLNGISKLSLFARVSTGRTKKFLNLSTRLCLIILIKNHIFSSPRKKSSFIPNRLSWLMHFETV